MRKPSLWLLLGCLGVFGAAAESEPGQSASGTEPFVAAYADLSTPGPAHERLAKLVGSWRVEGRYRFGVAKEWCDFTARSDIAPILGGRFIVERFASATADGQLEGVRIFGHDNLRAAFVMLGLTNQGTQLDHLASHAQESGQNVVLRGNFRNPATGETHPFAMEYDLGTEDSFSLRQYVYAPSVSEPDLRSSVEPVVEAIYHREASAPKQGPLEQLGSVGRDATITPWRSEPANDANRQLSSLAGRWQVQGRLRFEPEGTWENFRATSHIEEIMSGRFVLERIHGEQTASWPVPYEGLRIVGFDGATGRFQYAALNNLSTAIHFATGPGSADEQSIVVDAAILNPISRTVQPWRTTYRLMPQGLELREYPTDPSGRSYLGIFADYRRVGGQ